MATDITFPIFLTWNETSKYSRKNELIAEYKRQFKPKLCLAKVIWRYKKHYYSLEK